MHPPYELCCEIAGTLAPRTPAVSSQPAPSASHAPTAARVETELGPDTDNWRRGPPITPRTGLAHRMDGDRRVAHGHPRRMSPACGWVTRALMAPAHRSRRESASSGFPPDTGDRWAVAAAVFEPSAHANAGVDVAMVACMSLVTCHMSISLDGFVAGPDQGVENPIGVDGLKLHQWHVMADEPGHEGGERLFDGVADPGLEPVEVVLGRGRRMSGIGLVLTRVRYSRWRWVQRPAWFHGRSGPVSLGLAPHTRLEIDSSRRGVRTDGPLERIIGVVIARNGRV